MDELYIAQAVGRSRAPHSAAASRPSGGARHFVRNLDRNVAGERVAASPTGLQPCVFQTKQVFGCIVLWFACPFIYCVSSMRLRFLTVSIRGSITLNGLEYYKCLKGKDFEEFKQCDTSLMEKVMTYE